MASVFVSYSRKDGEIARKIVDELKQQDIDIWIDWEGIPPSGDWLTEIYKGIENSDVFLFVLSPDSLESRVCAEELEHAEKNGKKIIPVVVRKEFDFSIVPSIIAKLNWIFLKPDDGGVDEVIHKLILEINTDYEWIETHRRLQVKALEWERGSRDEAYLLRGRELAGAEHALTASLNKEPYLTALQKDFIYTSRRSLDRRKRVVILSTVSLSVFFFLIGFVLGRYMEGTRSATPIGSGAIVIGVLIVLGAGVLAGYFSRSLFLQSTDAKFEQTEQGTEEPDPLLPETVFISYKRADWEDYVKPLVIHLREKGYKVWIDQNNLEVSNDWMDKINEALKICQRLVLCVSPESLDSRYVKMEYRYFLHHEKMIFPLILKNAEMPAELLGIQSTSFTQLPILTEKLRSVGRTER
jgi:hypothetical protein